MKIFKWFKLLFEKIRSTFSIRKRRPKVRIKPLENSDEILINQIKEILEKAQDTKEEDISELAIHQTEQEVKHLVAHSPKKKHRIFDPSEVKKELLYLNKNLINIILKQEQLSPVLLPKKDSLDFGIRELKQLAQNSYNEASLGLKSEAKELLESRFVKLDKFIQDRSLLRIYRIRENKRKSEEAAKKQQVKKQVGHIENLINQGNLKEAKNLLEDVASAINSLPNANQKKNLLEKFGKLKEKLRAKEIQINTKIQAIKFKEILAKEEQRKRIFEIEKEDARIQKEKEEQDLRQREADRRLEEQKKKQRLQGLLSRKSNWSEFEIILKKNGIEKFYHFTDRVNLDSIHENKGLFSWHYCDMNGICILRPGGSMQSRENDTTNGKRDYVRLSFNKEHPMLYIAKKDGRIKDSIWLEINIEVAFWQHTEFADVNAAAFKSYTPNIGSDIQYLKNIKFDILKKAEKIKHYKLEEHEKPYNQAEVLVKTWIPIEYITNINQF